MRRRTKGLTVRQPVRNVRSIKGDVMSWLVLLVSGVVLVAVVAWQRRGSSKKGREYHVKSSNMEHERSRHRAGGRPG